MARDGDSLLPSGPRQLGKLVFISLQLRLCGGHDRLSEGQAVTVFTNCMLGPARSFLYLRLHSMSKSPRAANMDEPGQAWGPDNGECSIAVHSARFFEAVLLGL